jgi:O-antigen ligase
MNYISISLFGFFLISLILEVSLEVKITDIPGFSLKNLSIYFMIVWLIFYNLVTKKPIIGKNKLNIPIILFIVYCLFSLLFTYYYKIISNYSLVSEMILFKSYMDAFIFLLIIYNFIHDIVVIKTLLFSLLGLFVILNLITILGSFNILEVSGIKFLKHGRSSGALSEANQYASFIVLFLPFCFHYIVQFKKLFPKIIAVVITLLGLYCLFLTGSRGGILSFVVGIIVYFILESKQITNKILLKNIALFSILIVFIIVSINILPEITKEGLKYNIFEKAKSASIFSSDYSSGRIEIWSKCIEVFMRNPIFGTGWNTIYQSIGFNSHNEYLLYLTTTGIIGFFLFILIFYRLGKTVFNFRSIENSENTSFYHVYLSGLTSFMVAMFFVNIYSPYIFLFLFSGLILKLGSVEQNMVNIKKT